MNPGATFVSNNGVPYAENQHYTDCYAPDRPGAIQFQANPELAQVAMAGGRRRATRRYRGGQMLSAAQLLALQKTGGSRRRGCGCNMRGGGCGCSAWKLRGGKRSRQRGGQCGKPQVAWLGGKRITRRQRGGNKGGFGFDVTQNVGGTGPIAEPVRMAIPCDARAGMQNPFTATPVQPDLRAPAFGYSLTPNMSGGSLSERIPNFEYSQTGAGYGDGNAYPASCYRAPGSEMPVYPATSAGFHFTPSTEGGATLPDGITAYNEVVANVARLGGARRSRMKRRRGNRKSRKSRRSSRK